MWPVDMVVQSDKDLWIHTGKIHKCDKVERKEEIDYEGRDCEFDVENEDGSLKDEDVPCHDCQTAEKVGSPPPLYNVP